MQGAEFGGQPNDIPPEEPIGPTEGAEPTEPEQSFDIDGKEYSLSDLRDFVKGGMLERDYRQKTAELAEERRGMEGLRQAAQAWQLLEQHPELVQVVLQKMQELYQGGGPEGGPAAPEQPTVPGAEETPWRQDISKLTHGVAQVLGEYDQQLKAYNDWAWQQYYAQREQYARTRLPELEKKYPWLDDYEVVSAFTEDQEADEGALEDYAKRSHEYHYKRYQSKQKVDLEARKANAKASVDTAKGGAGPAVPQAEQPKDWDSARASAMERLNALFTRGGGGGVLPK